MICSVSLSVSCQQQAHSHNPGQAFLKYCNIAQLPIDLLEAAVPPLYLSWAYLVSCLLRDQATVEYMGYQELGIITSMVSGVLRCISAAKGIPYLRTLPAAERYQEIRTFLDPLAKASASARRRAVRARKIVPGHDEDVCQMVAMMIPSFGQRVNRAELYYGTTMPSVPDSRFNAQGFAWPEDLGLQSDKDYTRHMRFWDKEVITCANCGVGDIEDRAGRNKSYKTSGCCHIITYCGPTCAAEHWKKAHKATCWTRRK